jgi:hypothetical protein
MIMEVTRVGNYPDVSHIDYFKVTRRGGIAGVDEQIEVVARGGKLHANVRAFLKDNANFELDSAHADELTLIAQRLIDASGDTRPRSGADMYHYTIEIGWNGTSRRFEIDGLATDEAIHGALELASRYLDGAVPA